MIMQNHRAIQHQSVYGPGVLVGGDGPKGLLRCTHGTQLLWETQCFGGQLQHTALQMQAERPLPYTGHWPAVPGMAGPAASGLCPAF